MKHGGIERLPNNPEMNRTPHFDNPRDIPGQEITVNREQFVDERMKAAETQLVTEIVEDYGKALRDDFEGKPGGK